MLEVSRHCYRFQDFARGSKYGVNASPPRATGGPFPRVDPSLGQTLPLGPPPPQVHSGSNRFIQVQKLERIQSGSKPNLNRIGANQCPKQVHLMRQVQFRFRFFAPCDRLWVWQLAGHGTDFIMPYNNGMARWGLGTAWHGVATAHPPK